VPRKVRELEADLRTEGFTRQSGKGSHRRWLHPLYPGHVVMSGKASDDAKPYQEREVLHAVEQVREAKRRQS
jgi:predicted RNA binding protein YcfA (HicA-like mRNA interferase family)